MYGKPGFETWEKVGRALRLPRRSAWNVAHGQMRAGLRTVQLLEAAEFRPHLGQAVANLKALIGDEPILPVSYTRPQAAKLERREQ